MSFTFAKHETFYIRDGWINKGIAAIEANPHVFLEPDAPETLGLGNVMVRALRYWMQVCGIASESSINRRPGQTLTGLGKLLGRYDPYLELEGSLWLVHSNLVSHAELATTWYWFFNHFVPTRFTYSEFAERIKLWLNAQPEQNASVAESSLHKDFDCLVKMYTPSQRDLSPEDVLESPLTALSLISAFTEIDDETRKKVRTYRFNSGRVESIHPLIVLSILLRAQAGSERHGARQVGLQTVLREPCNVGRVFNVGPTDFEDLLAMLNDSYPHLRVALTRTAGLDQLTLPEISADAVIEQYFSEQTDAANEVYTWSRPLKA